jgi:hypothetical protein
MKRPVRGADHGRITPGRLGMDSYRTGRIAPAGNGSDRPADGEHRSIRGIRG